MEYVRYRTIPKPQLIPKQQAKKIRSSVGIAYDFFGVLLGLDLQTFASTKMAPRPEHKDRLFGPIDRSVMPPDTLGMSGAVLYIRVSSQEQADSPYNLPTQRRKVEDRCKRDALPVLKTFVDAESARTADRTQFQEMLTYCRTHRSKVTHVVFADLSRLARNIQDQASTLTTFKQLGIIPVSCDERIEDSAAGKLSTNLLGVVNQFFSDSLSEKTRYRMAAGVEEGRWLHLAPIGYLNGTNGTSGLQVDTGRAALVRQAFEWVVTRSYSLEEILRRLKLLGLTTRRAGHEINSFGAAPSQRPAPADSHPRIIRCGTGRPRRQS